MSLAPLSSASTELYLVIMHVLDILFHSLMAGVTLTP